MSLRPLLVFSPHLDDAVLSAGCAVAGRPGSMIVTVLAGVPPDPSRSTPWDRSCGFGNAADAVLARRVEDEQATQRLGARTLHLEFVDGQYGPTDRTGMVAAIVDTVEQHPEHLLVGPLGLDHLDHVEVSDACLRAARALPDRDWLLAGDIPYRTERGRVEERRLRDLRGQGFHLEPVVLGPFDPELKRHARNAYGSQLRQLAGRPLDTPEAFWAVGVTTSARAAATTRSTG